jgi:hypothetical protein
MLTKAVKEESYKVRCAHCLEENFELKDVLLSEKVKIYTDTPLRHMTINRAIEARSL